jgi:hypothetical protein
LRQCGSGKSANAVRSGEASSSICATAGNCPVSMSATRSTWARDLLRPGLGEDRADRCGDHLGMVFAHLGQHVAHEMHPAALPAGALHHGRDGVDQAAVGVADRQLHPGQAAVAEVSEKLGPERLGLAVPARAAKDFPSAVGAHASRDHDGLGHHPAVEADLAVGRVQEQIGERDVVECPGAPDRDVGVELRADLGDLAFADPVGCAATIYDCLPPGPPDVLEACTQVGRRSDRLPTSLRSLGADLQSASATTVRRAHPRVWQVSECPATGRRSVARPGW